MNDIPRKLSYALVGAFTLAGLLLRVYGLQESLWLDELHTAWVVTGGVNELPVRAELGNCHATYFYLVWASINTFGMHEWSLRLPAIVAGTGLIPLMFLATRQWAKSRLAALLAAGLVAMDPWCIVFAQEARVYALLQWVGLLQLLMLWRVWQKPRLTNRIAMVGLSALLFYLHFTSLLLFVAEWLFGLYVCLRYSRRNRYAISQLLFDTLLIVAAMLPAWPLLSEIAARRSNWELFVPVPTGLQVFRLFPLDLYVLAPLFLVGCVTVWGLFLKKTGNRRRIPLLVWLLTATWFLVPIATAVVLTCTDTARVFHIRYLITVALAPILFSSLMCAVCERSVRRGFVAIMLLLALFSHGPCGQIARDGDLICHGGENWRDALQWIRDRSQENATLFFRSALIEADDLSRQSDPEFLEYCQFPLLSIYGLNDLNLTVILLPTSATEHFLEFENESWAAQHAVLMVVRGPKQYADRLFQKTHLKIKNATQWKLEKKHFRGVSVARLLDFGKPPTGDQPAQPE